jgi:release factor glutamine methyltransferase
MMHRVPTVKQVTRDAEKILKLSPDIEHPHLGKERYDVEDLISFVMGREPDGGEELSGPGLGRFRRLLARRARGEPVAYLTGRTTFGNLTLEVGRGAFIPRESSEFMAEQAARRLRRRKRPIHVDMATGIGPVALVVASAVPRAKVFGVDLSRRPVELARRNATRLRLRNVTFLRGDLFAPLPARLRGSVDVITVHPPYVGKREIRELPNEIRFYEPMESLTDRSPGGLGLLGRVAAESPAWLRPGGWLLVEVSPDRSRAVAKVLRDAGFRDVRSTKGGVEVSRVVVGRNQSSGA